MFLLGAIVSLCYVPGLTGAYIATQWPVLAVLLPFALFRKGPFMLPHACMLAFVAYATVLLNYSPVWQAGVFGLWLVVITGLCLWFGTVLNDVRKLYMGLAAGGAVSSFVAVLQYFGFTGVAMTSAVPVGLYVNSVQQGTVLALIAVALISERMPTYWVVPLLPGLALAQSRGAWITLAVGLLAFSLCRTGVAVAVGLSGLVLLFSPASLSDAERLFIWFSTLDNLTLFGWGPGSFYTVLLSRDGVTSFYPEYAHNDALQLVFEYGIGAVLMFAVFGYALCRPRAQEWPVVVAFVAAGFFSMPLYMPVAAFLVFTAVGRILRTDGLASSDGSYSGQYVVSWPYVRRSKDFSLAPHLAAKG